MQCQKEKKNRTEISDVILAKNFAKLMTYIKPQIWVSWKTRDWINIKQIHKQKQTTNKKPTKSYRHIIFKMQKDKDRGKIPNKARWTTMRGNLPINE